jgi:hypothetical protein
MSTRHLTRSLAVAALLTLSACADLPTTLEGGWQAAHLVDVAQTFHGAASDRCYKEGDPVSRALIGEHPSHTGVVLWGVGYAVAHYVVTSWLEEHAPRWALYAWQGVTLVDAVRTDVHNYSVGVRIGRPNTDYAACPQWARP